MSIQKIKLRQLYEIYEAQALQAIVGVWLDDCYLSNVRLIAGNGKNLIILPEECLRYCANGSCIDKLTPEEQETIHQSLIGEVKQRLYEVADRL